MDVNSVKFGILLPKNLPCKLVSKVDGSYLNLTLSPLSG